jgi:hypothetical protein
MSQISAQAALGSLGTSVTGGGVALSQMTKIVLLALGLLCCLPPSAYAQNPTAPVQSLQDTQSACSIGSQSLRVCSNGLQSCNSVCTARALDPNADIAGCSTSCCTQYNVCLNLRGCGSLVINCE